MTNNTKLDGTFESAKGLDVTFDCGEGADAYSLVLLGKSRGALRSFFEQAKDRPDIKGKQDEALVAALLKAAPADTLNGVIIYYKNTNGQTSDRPDGTAALREWNAAGEMIWVLHKRDGKRNDAADGTPASQHFDAGQLFDAQRYQDDKRQDGPNGEAASWYLRGNGRTLRIGHFNNDLMTDPADGTPASLTFEEKHGRGRLTMAFHYSNGNRGKQAGIIEGHRLQKKLGGFSM